MRIKHGLLITLLFLGFSCASPTGLSTDELEGNAPSHSGDGDLDSDATDTAIASDELVANEAGACTDQPPAGNDYSCAQQAAWGKCGEPWMQGFCKASCGRCGAAPNGDATGDANGGALACTDVPPAGHDYTCAQQAGWGKCGEPWMQNFCDASCGRCGRGEARPRPVDGNTTEVGCSLPSDELASARFTNLCLAPVSIYWVDFNCVERAFGDISPNQVLKLSSYVGHSFRVRVTSSGRYLGDVVQIPSSVNVTICGN